MAKRQRASDDKPPECKACRYFLLDGEEQGFCRRYPPTVQAGMDIRSYFPPVKAIFWCGEHQAR